MAYEILSYMITYTLGIFAGIGIVRYGIRIGSMMSYKEQVGEPLFGNHEKPTEQEVTGE